MVGTALPPLTMHTPPAVRQVARFARQEKLFRSVQDVLVAVSGGPDSVACLLLLLDLRAEFAFNVHASHFDHKLRPDSAGDMAFVRDLCAKLDVPCYSGEGDVAAVARQQRHSLEETARDMRYQFLGFVAAEKRIAAIATGHTGDDQAETVLMRVLRGSGVRGIRGMLPVSPVPGAPSLKLLRPLLCLGRADTRSICAAAGITPRVDPSNDDQSLLRNRLRHTAMAQLEAVNPALRSALLGLSASAREVFAGVERESFTVQPVARTPVGAIFERKPLAALQGEARTLVIEREASFYKLEPEVNRTRVENLARVLAAGGGLVRFGNVMVEVSAGKVRVGPLLADEPGFTKVLNVPGATIAGEWRVALSLSPLPPADGAAIAAFDSAAVRGALRIRSLLPGDRIRYHGIVRKVSDLLANEKVPSWERLGAVAIAGADQVLVVFTAAGTFESDAAPGAERWHVRVNRTG
jgi:tRNA(Ile)-lysidine synthase